MKHFSFDDFRLEPANQMLFREDVPVPLPPKAFDTLVYLLNHPGRLITREELMEAIWPDTFVEAANLTVYVSLLRKALGEENGRRYIETVPRKGYRFVADVSVVDDDPKLETAAVPQPASAQEHSWRRGIRVWAVLVLLVAAGGIWFLTARFRNVTQVRRVRLTSFGPELAVTAAAISPDGNLVAYANSGGIVVQQIDTGEAHPLPPPTPSFTTLDISWFPDEARIIVGGFAVQADTPSLWVLPVMGRNGAVKIGDGLQASVSPDGRQIAVSDNPHWSPPESSKTAAPEMRLMRSDGEGPRNVVSGNPGEVFGPVAWNADGRSFRWVRYQWDPQLRRNNGSIESYDLDRAKASVLFTGADLTGDVANLAGGRVAFAQLLGANPSSKYGSRISTLDSISRPALLDEAPEPVAGLTASSSGTRLLVRNAVVEHSVFVGDLASNGTSLANIRRLTLGMGREDFPRAWTPDSQAVVFDSNRNGAWELFRQNLNTTADVPLVRSSDDSFTPRLSPDGASFLYIDRPRNWAEPAPVSIVRTPVSGGPTELVLKEAGISEWGLRFECAGVPGGPCVLAQQQGNQIVFRRFDPDRGIDARTGDIARIDGDPAHAIAWTLAPDGTRLAWARWESNEARIHVVTLGSGSEHDREIIVRGCSHIHSLHWSVDGKGWFLTSEWPSNWTISYAGSDGIGRILLSGSGAHAPDSFPSPDGRHLAFSKQITGSNVWLLELSH